MSLKAFRVLDTGLLTAAENMALDEVILEEVAAGRSMPTLRFLRFDPPAVLVGRHQVVAREVREEFCQDQGIHINRRLTGGGAIFFQPSALGWGWYGIPGQAPLNAPLNRLPEVICQASALAVTRLGAVANYRPRNDIEVNGRKIGGTGGVFIPNGYMFQGTLLIENEILLFLKSLRVPVEKLKKRELESLEQRVCFLNDLLSDPPGMDAIKKAHVQAFEEILGLPSEPVLLTEEEKTGLARRLSWFESDAWINNRRGTNGLIPGYWSLHQTSGGTFRTHLWIEPRVRRIRQALITGDFFCRPERFVLDLEAALKGVKAEKSAVQAAALAFFEEHDGEFLDVAPSDVVNALTSVIDRLNLTAYGLDQAEANEIFLVNMKSPDIERGRACWLLLPYCSKKTDCYFRHVPDCGLCGECDIGRLYEYGRQKNLQVYSVQSFEHLMEVLDEIVASRPDPDNFFIGSCCEAFFAKHQLEMEASGARGVLVNLDSTTCYDLGKGMEAYVGRFDHQTDINTDLIERVIQTVNG